MQKLIILAAVAACCLAAPSTLSRDDAKELHEIHLERPSPINPEVPMAPKPSEKITIIKDPTEIAKHKRESVYQTQPSSLIQVTPTVQHNSNVPAASTSTLTQDHEHDHQQQHHREKRDSTKVQKLKHVEKPATSTAKPVSTPAPTPKRTYKPRSTPIPKKPEPIQAPVKHRQKRDELGVQTSATPSTAPVPLIFRNGNNQPYVGASAAVSSESAIAQISPAHLPVNEHSNSFVRPQTLPAFLPIGAATSTLETKPQTLPALNHALQAQTLPYNYGASTTTYSTTAASAHIDAKRDIPVPLVPKHHHPEESPKADDEKKPEEKTHEVEHKVGDHINHAASTEDVQIEALSGAIPVQQHHVDEHHNQYENKHPQQHVAQNVPHENNQHQDQQQHHFQPQHSYVSAPHNDATSSAVSTTSSTTTHPLIRHHPVPVAELFAKPNHEQ